MIREGAAVFDAPYINEKGPGTINGVFYNRAMIFNRDTTIFLLHNVRVRSALDALSATGIRGIRMILENHVETTLNDINPESYRLILKNVELNGITAEVMNRNANSIMAERRFGYVDIDPFGTPVPFIDMALRSGKILGITATDTATLSGVHERIERRYIATLKVRGNHELGIRVLLGYIARMAARFDLGISPVFSFWNGHAYRVYVKIQRGVGHAKDSVGNVKNTEYGGPIWMGQIHDFSFLNNARIPDVPTKKLLRKYLELWKGEQFFMYHEIPKICSSLHISQPPLEKIMDALREIGFEAHRTQFSPQGIKTDAPKEKIKEILKKLQIRQVR